MNKNEYECVNIIYNYNTINKYSNVINTSTYIYILCNNKYTI